MQLDISENSIPVYEVLSSPTRINIIKLLSKKKMNIGELAKELNISSAIVSRHITKMSDAGLVKTETIPGKSGLQKVVILKVDRIEIQFPQKIYSAYESYKQEIPVGHYFNFDVYPTCGLATTTQAIGEYDDPKYFMDPQKNQAAILWFTKGFIEYRIPSILKETDRLEMIDIVLEASSEFPYSNNVWPSDITFSLNGKELCTWTSPGDFSDTRGRFTPDWWPNETNQYGILLTIRITKHGVYADGKKLSDTTIDEFRDERRGMWDLKVEIKEDAHNVGGVTLFGKGFGNYNQDINFITYYSNPV